MSSGCYGIKLTLWGLHRPYSEWLLVKISVNMCVMHDLRFMVGLTVINRYMLCTLRFFVHGLWCCLAHHKHFSGQLHIPSFIQQWCLCSMQSEYRPLQDHLFWGCADAYTYPCLWIFLTLMCSTCLFPAGLTSLQAQTWLPASAIWQGVMMVNTMATYGVRSTPWTSTSVDSERRASWTLRYHEPQYTFITFHRFQSVLYVCVFTDLDQTA